MLSCLKESSDTVLITCQLMSGTMIPTVNVIIQLEGAEKQISFFPEVFVSGVDINDTCYA